MSGLAYAGKIPLGPIMPLAFSAMGQASLALSAQLQGALALEASLNITPPTLALTLQALIDFEAQLTAAASLGLPSVSFNLSACATLIAQINASFSFLAALGLLFGAPINLHAYSWDGTGAAFGPALTTELSGGWRDGTPASAHSNAVILAAVEAPAATALAAFFGGVP